MTNKITSTMIFTRESYEDLRSFTNNSVCKLAIPRCPEGKAICIIVNDVSERIVTEGDYIAKREDNKFYLLTKQEFERLHEVIT